MLKVRALAAAAVIAGSVLGVGASQAAAGSTVDGCPYGAFCIYPQNGLEARAPRGLLVVRPANGLGGMDGYKPNRGLALVQNFNPINSITLWVPDGSYDYYYWINCGQLQ
jgi:hypothetical protein